MEPRAKERLGGGLVAAIGAGLTAFNWHLAMSEGRYYMKASFLGPAFVVIGVALLLIPSPKNERASRGLPPAQGMREITPRWWAVLVVSLAAGGLNLYLI